MEEQPEDSIDQARTDNIWEQQGYSPLLSSGGGGTMAMVTMGPGTTSWGYPHDDDDDDDKNEVFCQSNPHDGEDPLAKDDCVRSGPNMKETNLTPESDFRMLAEQALLQLEADYAQTVGKNFFSDSTRAKVTSDESILSQLLPVSNETTENSSAKLQSVFSGTIDFAEWSDDDKSESNSNHYGETPLQETWNQQKSLATKSIPEIDGEAIRRALSNIRDKNAGFVSKYQEWEFSISKCKACTDKCDESKVQGGVWAASFIVPQSHSCIPKSILQLYSLSRNRNLSGTDNSDAVPSFEDETQQLSRSATLVDALCRTDTLHRQECLVVHLMGCDQTEQEDFTTDREKTPGESPDLIPNFLQPAMQWLPRARQVPSSMEFHIIGPNLYADRKYEVVESLPAPLQSVKIQYHRKLYHEFLQEQQSNEQTKSTLCAADLILSYNAGLWGYDDWKLTLQYLLDRCRERSPGEANSNQTRKKIPLVVTAYTLWEAQEDYEVLKTFFSPDESSLTSCMWKPQLNPFGSHKARPTSTAPPMQTELYRENAAWQAWRI